jgi:hypothetical protein
VSFFLWNKQPASRSTLHCVNSLDEGMQMSLVGAAYLLRAANAVAGQETLPQIDIESPATSVETYLARPVEQTITINNNSDAALTLDGIRPSNRGFEIVSVRPGSAKVPPHGSEEVAVRFVTHMVLGAHRVPFVFDFSTQTGTSLSARTSIGVFVQSAFEQDRPEIDLGVVAAPQGLTKRVAFTSSEIPGIELVKVIEAPEFLSLKLLDHGREISVSTKPSAPWGISQGFIRVATNSEIQPEVLIKYQVDVRGEVIPSQNPVNFSPDNVGSEQEETVRLVRSGGKRLDIKSISVSGLSLKTRIDECSPSVVDCKLLRMLLPPDAPSGMYGGNVTVKFEGIANELPIAFGGFRLASGQKLRSLSDNAAAKTSVAITTAKREDIGKEIERATLQAKPRGSPPGRGPLLKWSVAHGEGAYGFVVYRSNSESGPFWRINKVIIRPEDDVETNEWRDDTAEPGKTYWYYIAVVQNDGHKRKLSDPQKVVAK